MALPHPHMTVWDFLALDRERFDQKYEFHDGEMVAMSGGSTNHTLMIGNLYASIHAHIKKSPCGALVEGTLRIENDCYLPDIMVTCNEPDLTENKNYVEYPKLVIEVLSPTTETYDRRDKFLRYSKCPSIQEYVLVNWDCMLIQKMTRKGQGPDKMQWIDEWYAKGETLELESIGLSLMVDDVYDKIVIPKQKKGGGLIR